jgi:hypothetical protein
MPPRLTLQVADNTSARIQPVVYYYMGYLIGNSSVILNLFFDTVLFVLLARVIEYVGGKEEE